MKTAPKNTGMVVEAEESTRDVNRSFLANRSLLAKRAVLTFLAVLEVAGVERSDSHLGQQLGQILLAPNRSNYRVEVQIRYSSSVDDHRVERDICALRDGLGRIWTVAHAAAIVAGLGACALTLNPGNSKDYGRTAAPDGSGGSRKYFVTPPAPSIA
jgi:hypothetical protein